MAAVSTEQAMDKMKHRIWQSQSTCAVVQATAGVSPRVGEHSSSLLPLLIVRAEEGARLVFMLMAAMSNTDCELLGCDWTDALIHPA